MELNDTLENLRIEFTKKYDRKKLEQLTLDEYALNSANHELSHDSFCYWIEIKLASLGNIKGSTAIKFGVYFGNVKSEIGMNWHLLDWTKEDFTLIRDELLSLYDAGRDRNLTLIQ